MKKATLHRALLATIVLIMLAHLVTTIHLYRERNHALTVVPNSLMTVTAETENTYSGTITQDRFQHHADQVILSYTCYPTTAAYHDRGFMPNATITFATRSKEYLDLSPYDLVALEIAAKNAQTLHLNLSAVLPGTTPSKKKPSEELFLTQEIPVWKGSQSYQLRMEDFTVPEWWFIDHKCSRYEPAIRKDFSRVSGIIVSNGRIQPYKTPITIIIKKMTFFTSYRKMVQASVLFTGIYSILLLAYGIYRWRRARAATPGTPIIIPYTHLELPSPDNDARQRLFTYLQENFQRPELSVEQASRETSLPVKQIPAIIRKEHQMSFPRYLHSLRVKKARELLTETDSKIIDIAFTVGYNSIGNFNLFFKQNTGVAPSEYRKKNHDQGDTPGCAKAKD